jgi:pimeloyl-ACP methyl ester carboxylesterase
MLKKAYVDTSQGQIHYRYSTAAGAGGLSPVPLVMLHKTASSSRMFEQVMHQLCGDYSMFALDTPGFGESYQPENVPDTGYYISALLEALDGLGIQQFNLLGHHTGANFGVEMAVKVPDRVRRLMLIGPSILNLEERDHYRQIFGPAFNRPVADGSHLQKTWDYIAKMGGSASVELHQREALDHIQAWRGRHQAYTVVWDQDFGAYYRQVRCPMQVMCARDDVLWPYFERALQARPDAHSAVIAGANFEPDIDPAGIAQAVRTFLDTSSDGGLPVA